jgi:hypothetical protein
VWLRHLHEFYIGESDDRNGKKRRAPTRASP